MLSVRDIHTFFGRSHILQGVSLELNRGEIVCLLGRNGVGKTTTLKSIIGLVSPKSGSILFNNLEIAGTRPDKIARQGISYVPEDRRIFPMLTVEENLILGMKNLRTNSREVKKNNFETVYRHFPRLRNRRKQLGGTLSGGEQQMATIARGLMGSPDVMLLDEPFEGLAPIVIKELMQVIPLLCKEAELTLLLVEQKVHLAISLSDRGYIIEKGSVTFEGSRDLMETSDEIKQRCGV